MTTTVAQLIEFLKQFPEDTMVEVLAGREGRNYDPDSYRRVDMSLEVDCQNEWYFKGTSFEYSVNYNKSDKTLFLGED